MPHSTSIGRCCERNENRRCNDRERKKETTLKITPPANAKPGTLYAFSVTGKGEKGSTRRVTQTNESLLKQFRSNDPIPHRTQITTPRHHHRVTGEVFGLIFGSFIVNNSNLTRISWIITELKLGC